MTKEEAIVYMVNGGYTSHIRSARVYFYSKDQGHFRVFRSRLLKGSDLVNVNNLFDDGWEIYSPPKKVKMWQWVVRSLQRKDVIKNTVRYYAKEEDVIIAYPSCLVLQKAEWTEIEVEV